VFMRLTCYSDSNSQTLKVPTGSVGGNAPGAFSEVLPGGAIYGRYAGQNYSVFHACASPVDSAGWTEVVILKGHGVLSNFIKGRSAAEVNASVDCVSGSVLYGDRLTETSCGLLRGGARERSDLSDMNSSRLSCSNNKEVTI
jgi:hypothetical protein